jgi:hypothetical protein
MEGVTYENVDFESRPEYVGEPVRLNFGFGWWFH